jgi:hypothetical protein
VDLFLACCLPFDRVDLLVRIFIVYNLFDFLKTPQGKNFSKDTECATLICQETKIYKLTLFTLF